MEYIFIFYTVSEHFQCCMKSSETLETPFSSHLKLCLDATWTVFKTELSKTYLLPLHLYHWKLSVKVSVQIHVFQVLISHIMWQDPVDLIYAMQLLRWHQEFNFITQNKNGMRECNFLEAHIVKTLLLEIQEKRKSANT